ncbi:hypothetical protein RW115_01135 [Macrococcus capreoli]
MDIKIFLMIAATGVPGFISYWILSQFKLFDIRDNNKDDKIILLSSLSVLNILVSYLVCDFFSINFKDGSYVNILIILALSVLVVLINSVLIYPLFISFIKKNVLLFQRHYNISIENNKTVIENIMYSRPNNTDTQVYIFDFDNKLILEGGLGFVSNVSSQLSIRNIIDAKTSYDEAIKIYNETDNLSREILIDYEKKIKIIFIHF